MEEADRKMKEAKGQPHPVTPEEQKVLDRQMQDKRDLSSYSYYTSSEDAPGEGVRLVPKAEVKEDPKDPSSSESSSDDDDEDEEEECEDPDEEGSEQSELFEAEGKFTSNVAAGAAGKSSKKLPEKPVEVKPETKLADDQEEMKRLEEVSRALEQEEEENRFERNFVRSEVLKVLPPLWQKKNELRRKGLTMRLHFRGKLRRLKLSGKPMRKKPRGKQKRKKAGRQQKNCRKQWRLLINCREMPIRQVEKLRESSREG